LPRGQPSQLTRMHKVTDHTDASLGKILVLARIRYRRMTRMQRELVVIIRARVARAIYSRDTAIRICSVPSLICKNQSVKISA
jgi:hypothetical protein